MLTRAERSPQLGRGAHKGEPSLSFPRISARSRSAWGHTAGQGSVAQQRTGLCGRIPVLPRLLPKLKAFEQLGLLSSGGREAPLLPAARDARWAVITFNFSPLATGATLPATSLLPTSSSSLPPLPGWRSGGAVSEKGHQLVICGLPVTRSQLSALAQGSRVQVTGCRRLPVPQLISPSGWHDCFPGFFLTYKLANGFPIWYEILHLASGSEFLGGNFHTCFSRLLAKLYDFRPQGLLFYFINLFLKIDLL